MSQAPEGLAVIDKPAGWTSHDVVAKLRGILGTRKVGHAGTLDPSATGVLLVGVGRATRLMRFLTPLTKIYTGEIVLGVTTSTLDADGEVLETFDMSEVTLDAARDAARQLTGDILQVPPMVSAIKVDGKRLHELAREGVEIEREARPITVHRFDLSEVEGEPGVLRAEVECSSGTYVRSLAADLGALLGGGAHLRSLRRMAIGSFTVAEAHPIESPVVLSPAEALRDQPKVVVADDVATLIGHGRVLDRSLLGAAGEGPWAVLDHDGRLLAVYELTDGDRCKPAMVLAT